MSEFDEWGVLLAEDSRIHGFGALSSMEWVSSEEMDAGLFQWLLLWRPPLDSSKESKCEQPLSLALPPLLSFPLLQQGLGR